MQNFPSNTASESFDYTYVPTKARVAVYDDMKMAPHVIEIKPAPTKEFIEALASCVNEQKMALGGEIPYAAIREVTENFIHAQFNEVVVSILDKGNTIRFCDQGPGIADKQQAIRPGFTSAIEPMKEYIRGVGSGLPLVKEYLDYSDGNITIEDNMGNGAVITISLKQKTPVQTPKLVIPPLTTRERDALKYIAAEGVVTNKEIADYLEIGGSSAYTVLAKLEEYGYIERTYKKKRMLTDLGSAVSEQI